jgi:hypothetical protein
MTRLAALTLEQAPAGSRAPSKASRRALGLFPTPLKPWHMRPLH